MKKIEGKNCKKIAHNLLENSSFITPIFGSSYNELHILSQLFHEFKSIVTIWSWIWIRGDPGTIRNRAYKTGHFTPIDATPYYLLLLSCRYSEKIAK